jgi:acetyl-CoA decarbonylase/synthase complex subunit alpha
MRKKDLMGKIEVVGICCTAHDLTRYEPRAKIVGPISWQLKYIRSGLADVIVVDEQCIRADTLEEAQKVHTPVIATREITVLVLKTVTLNHLPKSYLVSFESKVPGA